MLSALLPTRLIVGSLSLSVSALRPGSPIYATLCAFLYRLKTAEDDEELEVEVLTLACQLFQRLALSDHNLREMRTCGAVKVLKSCLASKNRDLRTVAEATMNQVLSLSDG